MKIQSWLNPVRNRLIDVSNRSRMQRRKPAKSNVAWIELLEPRQLMSAAAIGFETRVNTYTPGNQDTSEVATDLAGDYVVTWQSSGQDGSGEGVYAQRFNSSGVALGAEFRVNNVTAGFQGNPSVAMDSSGDFVITWSSLGQDGSGYGIYARRYNSVGVAQGNEFLVNTYTTNQQTNPSIAMDSKGDFVVTWTSAGEDGSGLGVYAQVYNSAGVAQGTQFLVNTFTTGDQQLSRVAMDSVGDFVVTWESNNEDLSGQGIYAQRYSLAGVAQGSEFAVNTFTTGFQGDPSVAMDQHGDFVIAWSSFGQDGNSYGVYARRYNSSGVAQGTEFLVNTYTTGTQSDPVVAMDGAGDFVATWASAGQDGSGEGVYGQLFNATGAESGTEFRVNAFTVGDQTLPATAMDAGGAFVVTWQSSNQDDSGNGVYSQRYKQTTIGPIVTAALDGPVVIMNNARLTAPVNQIVVDFSENMNVTGGTTGASSVINPANWQLTTNGAASANAIQNIAFAYNAMTNQFEATVTFAIPLNDGLYKLTASSLIQNATGQNLDGLANGVAGNNYQLTFYVAETVAAGPEVQVNTFTTGDQSLPAIATDAVGDYVVVWSSNGEDGSNSGIYAQRYSGLGVPQGTEFLVNTNTAGSQTTPSVAMDKAGDFVVTWNSIGQDGSGGGIYAQRYNSSGAAVGGELRVNTYTTGNQAAPKVAMDQAGDFVITWQSNNEASPGSGYDIYAQRYTSSGTLSGTEFLVNSFTTSNQTGPSIAMDQLGDFVIAWTSANESSASDAGDIYAQRFNFLGQAQGGEFLVNTYATNLQTDASVAMDAVGDFVVTWSSNNEQGATSGTDIFGQRYSAAGIAIGSELAINTFTTGNQTNPAVAMDANGDFAVTWQSDSQDGSLSGVYGRQFSAGGMPLTSGEFQINTTTTNSQDLPAAAMDRAGDFLVTWQSANQDGGGYGVYSQRYQTDMRPLVRGVAATLLQAPGPLYTPLLLSASAFDYDTTTLTGATVQITGNYVSQQDVLGFVNQLGITGAWNPTTGTLTLSGVSSLANYTTALEAVTYHNTSASPDTFKTRTITVIATDGLLTSTPMTRNFTVLASVPTPVLGGVSGTGTYVDQDPMLLIAGQLTITDTFTGNLVNAQVSFTNWQPGDRVNFNNIFALQHSFSENLAAQTAVLTITGSSSVYNYQTLLRSVIFWDVSYIPGNETRVAKFVVNDGQSSSNIVSRNIAVVNVNFPPQLSAIESTPLAFQVGDSLVPSLPISATLLVSDPDRMNLTRAVVQISSGYENDANGHDVLSFVNQLGITGSFNAATGTLTLSGTSYVGNYRTALRSVTFSTSGPDVSTANRVLTISATDDFVPPATSLPITRTVAVSTTVIPPALTGIPTTALPYARGGAAITLIPNLYILDPESPYLAGATVQITANDQSGQDLLAATTVSGITSSFNSTTGLLTLSGTATLAAYQSVLRSVTYQTSTNAASTLPRSITMIVNDGIANSYPVTVVVNPT